MIQDDYLRLQKNLPTTPPPPKGFVDLRYSVELGSLAIVDETGAEASVSGSSGVTDYFQFNTALATEPTGLGALYWSDSGDCLEYNVTGGSISVGKETFDYYKNLSGVAMVDGDIVSIVGATGNRTAVTLTDATDATKSSNVIGMVTHGAANNGTVRVTKMGSVHSLNTNGLTEGGTVYVDPTTPGKWTMTRPTSPNHVVSIGVVQVTHSVNGVVDVVPNHQCITAADITDASASGVSVLTGTPAQGRAAMEVETTTSGEVSKIPKLSASGQLNFTSTTPSGLGSITRGIYLGDLEYFGMLKADGSKMGGLYGWEAHSGGGETILDSSGRIAIAPAIHKGLQLGLSIDGSTGYTYFQSQGAATAENAGTSQPVYLSRNYWTGAASALANTVGFEAIGSGINSELKLFAGGSMPDDAGVDGTRPEVVAVTVDGLRDPGNYPAFGELTDGASITATCSKTKSSQNHKLLIGGNRSLIIADAEPGMRGVILVTQDGTGSRTLTPTEGTALDLSTTAGVTDRVSWDYDGVYFHWSTVKNVALSIAALDADASAFLTAASITALREKAAVNALVGSLKAADLWTRFYAIYPFVGDVGDGVANSKNLKGATYAITWANAPTHDSNGVTGGGTAYGDTGINLSTLGATNSAFGYVYSKTTSPTDNKYFFGAYNTNRFGLHRGGTSVGGQGPNNGEISMSIGASSDFRRHIAINRASANVAQLYLDSTVSSVNTVASVAAPNAGIRLLARSDGTTNCSNANLAFAAFGSSVSPAEWADFINIIDTFQTALGRANP